LDWEIWFIFIFSKLFLGNNILLGWSKEFFYLDQYQYVDYWEKYSKTKKIIYSKNWANVEVNHLRTLMIRRSLSSIIILIQMKCFRFFKHKDEFFFKYFKEHWFMLAYFYRWIKEKKGEDWNKLENKKNSEEPLSDSERRWFFLIVFIVFIYFHHRLFF
jgi:hypothetical protein